MGEVIIGGIYIFLTWSRVVSLENMCVSPFGEEPCEMIRLILNCPSDITGITEPRGRVVRRQYRHCPVSDVNLAFNVT